MAGQNISAGTLAAVKGNELPCIEVTDRTHTPWHKELHHDVARALAETEPLEHPDYETGNGFLINISRLMASTEPS